MAPNDRHPLPSCGPAFAIAISISPLQLLLGLSVTRYVSATARGVSQILAATLFHMDREPGARLGTAAFPCIIASNHGVRGVGVWYCEYINS